MRADRIEVAQQHNRPIRIRFSHVGENAFIHVFRPTVRIGAAGGHGLIQRHVIGNAVHRRRRAENKALHAMFFHGLTHSQRTIQIVTVILQRFGDGLAYGLIRREVNHCIHCIFIQNPIHRRKVAGIRVVKLYFFPGQFFYAINNLLTAVVEIIHHNNVMARIQQFNRGVRTNKTGAASQKNVHRIILLPFLWLLSL